jgi:hypothetical protein
VIHDASNRADIRVFAADNSDLSGFAGRKGTGSSSRLPAEAVVWRRRVVCENVPVPVWARPRPTQRDVARLRQSYAGQAAATHNRLLRVRPAVAGCDELCRDMTRYAKLCQDMPSYAEICRVVPRYSRFSAGLEMLILWSFKQLSILGLRRGHFGPVFRRCSGVGMPWRWRATFALRVACSCRSI